MALTQVNSAGIADGAIVNADINNSAAVALSKLATSGTASSSNYLRGDGAWSAIDLSTKLNLTGGTLTGNVIHNDSVKALFGTGSDLEIYHNGSNSFIKNNTNAFRVLANDFGVNNAANGEVLLRAVQNGSVYLNYDDSKKLETYSHGTKITGNLWCVDDNGKGLFGDNTDLQISHDGTHNIINNHSADLHIKHGAEVQAKFIQDGAVELYYDGSKKLRTYAGGVRCEEELNVQSDLYIANDNKKLFIGAGDDLQIYHDGNNSYVYDTGTGSLILRSSRVSFNDTSNNEWGRFDSDGLRVVDSKKFRAGTGDDLQIYHDGSNSHVRHTGTGDLYIEGGAGNAADVRIDAQTHIYMHVNGNESCFFAQQNAHVSLYYDGSQKFYTQSDKVVSAGHHYPESSNSYDLGHSSYRWRNIYVNDMHFSNEGSTNSVDGTWGDWTLQEGDENIFMINNRSGKRYKMALQEVN